MKKLDPRADGASKDITAENIEALKHLFPECVTEGKIDFDVLRELLGDEIDDRPERYSFTWNGKSRARRIAQTPSTGTLPYDQEEWTRFAAMARARLGIELGELAAGEGGS